jgi:hypothetical protein
MLPNCSPLTIADELRQPTDEKAHDDATRVALIEQGILVLLARVQPDRGPASRANLSRSSVVAVRA